MTSTREQFKELMTFIKNAQEKEDKVNDAFELISLEGYQSRGLRLAEFFYC